MENSTVLHELTQELQARLSEAISTLVNKPVSLSIAQSGTVTMQEIHQQVDKQSHQVTTVYIPLMGDVTGDVFLFLPARAGCRLVDLLLTRPLGTTQVLDDFEVSALKEVGNISTGVIVTTLANRLKVSMMLTTPNLATDMPGALIDQVLIEYGETGADLLAIEFAFQLTEWEIEGIFLLMFDGSSSQLMRDKLSRPV